MTPPRNVRFRSTNKREHCYSPHKPHKKRAEQNFPRHVFCCFYLTLTATADISSSCTPSERAFARIAEASFEISSFTLKPSISARYGVPSKFSVMPSERRRMMSPECRSKDVFSAENAPIMPAGGVSDEIL